MGYTSKDDFEAQLQDCENVWALAASPDGVTKEEAIPPVILELLQSSDDVFLPKLPQGLPL